MHPYPHRYLVTASGTAAGSVAVSAPQLPPLATAPPPECDGPGGVWSPENCCAVRPTKRDPLMTMPDAADGLVRRVNPVAVGPAPTFHAHRPSSA
jgi:hypothetical protein